jgi:hypothetical protein
VRAGDAVDIIAPQSSSSLRRVVVLVAVAKQLFRVVESIDTGLPVVKMRGWDPFGVTVFVFAGDPALFGERVVAAAAER